MSKNVIDGKSVEIKLKTRYPSIDFDKLQIYCGIPYTIDLENASGTITINIPTLGEFVQVGEKLFYSNINIFTTNTTSCRLFLWDAGVDWNTISDFELFCMFYKQVDNTVSEKLFGFNIASFELYKKGEEVVIYNEELDIEINEHVYQHIAQYLRIVFNIKPEEKITKDQVLKQMYIQKDRAAIENSKNKEQENHSIQSLLSSCVNHPGFKYNLKQAMDISIYEFFDSVARLNIYENSIATLRGMYSGFVDTSHIKPENYNFMRDI